LIGGPKATLEALRAEEQGIRDRAALLERELNSKLKDGDRAVEAAGEKVEKLKGELERMKAGYYEVLAKVEGEERQELEAKAVMVDDVRSGKVSMQDYFAQGTNAEEIRTKAKATAEAKTLELARLIREKAKAVIEAEVEFHKAESDLQYLLSAPGMLWIEGLKEFLKRAEGKIAGMMGGWPLCRAKLEEKKAQLARANDSGVADGERWPDLDEKALQELKLNPQIIEDWLPAIDDAIKSIAGTGKKLSVLVGYHRGPRRGISFVETRTR